MSNSNKTHGGHELAELVRKAYEKGEIDYSLNPITLGTGFIKAGSIGEVILDQNAKAPANCQIIRDK